MWLFVLCSVSFDCTMTTKKKPTTTIWKWIKIKINPYIQLHKNIEKEKKKGKEIPYPNEVSRRQIPITSCPFFERNDVHLV